MSRDWQKDMELASRPEFANRKMVLYWLQQAAEWKARAYEVEVKAHEEKERADKLQKEIDYRIWSCKQNKMDYIETKNRADKAEENYAKLRSEHIKLMGDAGEYLEREQKLRETIDWVKHKFENEWTYEPGIGEVVDEIIGTFDSLYPQEGEAQ